MWAILISRCGLSGFLGSGSDSPLKPGFLGELSQMTHTGNDLENGHLQREVPRRLTCFGYKTATAVILNPFDIPRNRGDFHCRGSPIPGIRHEREYTE